MKIEMLNTWEQQKPKAEQILDTILMQADFFEIRTGMKPTIFMSYDIFALLAYTARDMFLAHPDKNTPQSICGYDLEIIQQGEELLYVGYRINL
jgi:hypothetical protein